MPTGKFSVIPIPANLYFNERLVLVGMVPTSRLD